MRKLAARLAAAALALQVSSAAAQQDGGHDLALVLAIDSSGSVDGSEFQLQLDGIAAAFGDAEIVAAALSGPHRRIAVNIVSWGDPDYEKFQTGWITIDSEQAARDFAATARGFSYRSGGGTGLGLAIAYGVTLIETGGLEPLRKVIDVSGDGKESYEIRPSPYSIADAQARREAAAVIVNGLAILTDETDLEAYYRANVAGGPGSFVMAVNNYKEYAEAIRLKLLREIRPQLAKN